MIVPWAISQTAQSAVTPMMFVNLAAPAESAHRFVLRNARPGVPEITHGEADSRSLRSIS